MNLQCGWLASVPAVRFRLSISRFALTPPLLGLVLLLMIFSPSDLLADNCVWLLVKKWKVKMHLTQVLNTTGVLQKGPDCTANYTLALDQISDVTGEFSNTGSQTLWQGTLASEEVVNNRMDITWTGRPECSLGEVHFTEIGSGPGSEENVSLVIDPAAGKYVISFPHTGIDVPAVYSAPNVPPPAGPVYFETVLNKEINGGFIIDYPGMVLSVSSSDPVTTLEFSLPANPNQGISGETTFVHGAYPEIPITWSWELTPDFGDVETELGSPNGNRQAEGGDSSPGSGYGAPAWSVNMANLNIFMTDTPLWYHNPIGPSVELSLSYNSKSVTSRFEPVGRKWQLNYESYLSADEITSDVTIYMPDGRRDVYTYTPTGFTPPYRVFNELKVIRQGVIMEGSDYELTFPDGTVYVYKVPSGSLLWSFLSEIRDPHGNKLSLEWEGLSPWGGKLKKITDSLGRYTTFFHNTDNRITSVSDPFGRWAYFQYDDQGNLTKITDMGGYSTDFTYDGCGEMKSMIKGNNTSFFESDAEGLTVRDNLGSERFILDPDQGTASYQAASAEAGVVSGYSMAPAMDGSGHTDVTGYRTPEGVSSDYTYDAKGNQLTSTLQAATGNQTSTFTYNSKGKVTSVRDPRGALTQLTYASNKVDLLKLKDGLGTITATYNSTHDILSLVDRMGANKTFVYNSYGQVLKATDALGVQTNYTYNSNHRLVRIDRNGTVIGSYQYDAIGRISRYTDINGYTRHYAYNKLDDLVSITYPDGSKTIHTYSTTIPHLLESIANQAGRVTTNEYNAHNQLRKIIDPEGGETRFDYDAAGHIRELIDPNGNTTFFTYDRDNRLVGKKYPDGSQRLFSYTDGRLKWAKNARGITTTYTYDKNGNQTKIRYSDGTPDVTTTYDAYNRPTTIVDGLGSHILTYDASSRLSAVDGPWPDDTVTYGYDLRGRKSFVALENGPTVSFSHDYLDRLTAVVGNGQTYTYSYQGDSMLLTLLQRSDNSVSEFGYDSTMKRLERLTNRTPAGELLSEQTFTFDPLGQPLEETLSNGQALQVRNSGEDLYTYNNLNQAITLNGSSMVFAYDLDGNMTKGLTGDGRSFDAVYDAENRLKSLQYTDGNGVVRKQEYVYGADGFAGVKKSYADGVLTGEQCLIWNNGLLLQERNGSNGVERSYIWGVARTGGVGALLALVQGGQTYQYFSNSRGDITAVLDSNGDVAAAYAHDPFGIPLMSAGTLKQPFGFSTKTYDEGTGLYYYGYRFYTPRLGRWLSRDPLAEVASINLYSFSGNNPIARFDPFGAADFSGLRPEHQAEAKAMYDAMQAKREAEISTAEKITHGIGAAFKWIGDKLKQNPEATNVAVDTIVDIALESNKYTKAGKEGSDRINTAIDLAEDVSKIQAAYYDKDPASGLTLVKQLSKHTVGHCPIVGDAMNRIVTEAVVTIETVPGGVKAMRNAGARADAAYRSER
jgi:RHS repeat-associated protein